MRTLLIALATVALVSPALSYERPPPPDRPKVIRPVTSWDAYILFSGEDVKQKKNGTWVSTNKGGKGKGHK